jgi:hypothetical protein
LRRGFLGSAAECGVVGLHMLNGKVGVEREPVNELRLVSVSSQVLSYVGGDSIIADTVKCSAAMGKVAAMPEVLQKMYF